MVKIHKAHTKTYIRKKYKFKYKLKKISLNLKKYAIINKRVKIELIQLLL